MASTKPKSMALSDDILDRLRKVLPETAGGAQPNIARPWELGGMAPRRIELSSQKLLYTELKAKLPKERALARPYDAIMDRELYKAMDEGWLFVDSVDAPPPGSYLIDRANATLVSSNRKEMFRLLRFSEWHDRLEVMDNVEDAAKEGLPLSVGRGGWDWDRMLLNANYNEASRARAVHVIL